MSLLSSKRFADKFFTTNLLVGAFLILGFIGINHHEMWQDEMQAWMIAKDSSSISNLLENLKYEGHPALWYVCLYFISRFTHNPCAMQVFHLVIATVTVYIIVEFAPFDKLQKTLLTFSYFPFYEYNIISRSYGLGLLLTFGFCALFSTHRETCLYLSLIISLLVHTSIFGLIIAIALEVTLLLEVFYGNTQVPLKKRDFVASLTIVIASITGAIFQIIPPSNGIQGNLISESSGVWVTIFDQMNDLNRFLRLVSNIWKSYFPIYQFSSAVEEITIALVLVSILLIISRIFGQRLVAVFLGILLVLSIVLSGFINQSLFQIIALIEVRALLGSLISVLILFFSAILFIQQPATLWLYLSGSAGILLFTYTIYYSDNLRHTGHFFILFLVCLWLSTMQRKHDFTIHLVKPINIFLVRYKSKLISLIIFIGFVAGMVAYSKDLAKPFSMSKATAKFIEEQQLDRLPIIGIPDERVCVLSGYLDRKIYYPQSDRLGSFIIWDSRRERIETQDIELNENLDVVKKNIFKRVDKMTQENQKNVLLVSNSPIKFKIPNLKITFIRQFTGDTIGRENSYQLYLLQKSIARSDGQRELS